MRSTFLFVSVQFRSSSHFIALRPHLYRRSQQGAIGTPKEDKLVSTKHDCLKWLTKKRLL
ncbi:hypothetical protein [Microcoleus sp. T2B6]|uniref:hypothetical protein n=1 Tax=Microcoleus sp. T2B6 TaxID=3055424 RepID=UPI002FD210A1